MWFTDDFCGCSDWPTDQKQRGEVSPWLFFFFPLATYCFFVRAHFLKTNKADEGPEFFFLFKLLKSNKKKKPWWGICRVNDWISRQLLLKHVGTHHIGWIAPHIGYDGQRLGVCCGVFLTAADKDILKYDEYQWCLNSCTHKLSGLALAANYFTITRWQLLCLGDQCFKTANTTTGKCNRFSLWRVLVNQAAYAAWVCVVMLDKCLKISSVLKIRKAQ